MNLLKTHNLRIVNQDFLLKYLSRTPNILPKFTKLTLSVKFNDDNKSSGVSLIELLTFQRPYLTQTKINSLSLNLRKGDLVGCKIVLRKKALYNFLDRFLFEVLPSSKELKVLRRSKKSIHWQLRDVFALEDTNTLFIILNNVYGLDIDIEASIENSNFFIGFRLPLGSML